MNFLDIAAVLALLFFAFTGYRRGLLRTLYGFASLVAALVVTGLLYSPVAGLLRLTPLHPWLAGLVSDSLGLEGFFESAEGAGQAPLFEELPLHPALREAIAERYAADALAAGAAALEGRVAGFLADMVLAALAIVLVFVAALVLLSVAGRTLDVVGRLPVINAFNNLGGLLVGLLAGACAVVLGFFVMNLLFGAGGDMQEMLDASFFSQLVREAVLARLFGRFV